MADYSDIAAALDAFDIAEAYAAEQRAIADALTEEAKALSAKAEEHRRLARAASRGAKDRMNNAVAALAQVVRHDPDARLAALRECYWGLPQVKVEHLANVFGVPRVTDVAVFVGPKEGHGLTCTSCGYELVLSSRAAEENYRAGKVAMVCRPCAAKGRSRRR